MHFDNRRMFFLFLLTAGLPAARDRFSLESVLFYARKKPAKAGLQE